MPSKPVPSRRKLEGSGTGVVTNDHVPGLLFIAANLNGAPDWSVTEHPTQPGGFVPENIRKLPLIYSLFHPVMLPRESVITSKAEVVALA
jgi:hypothetical protein